MRASLSINLASRRLDTSAGVTSRPRSNRILRSFRANSPGNTPKAANSLRIQIKNRSRSDRKKEVSADLAVEVVKNYILPMFESDNRARQDSKRSEQFGHVRGFSTDRGTVYSELKLSEKLGKEIAALEAQLEGMKQQFQDNEQEKSRTDQENKQLVLELSNASSNIIFLREENLRLQREITGVKFSIGNVSSQLTKYRSLFDQAISEKQLVSNQLQEEKASNDIRYNTPIALNSCK